MKPPHDKSAKLQRPPETTSAVLLLFASLTIGLIRATFGLTQIASGTALIFAGLIVTAFFALGFFLAWKIFTGKNWARVLLLVLVLINFPFALLGNFGELKQNILSGVLSIVIEVILWIGTYLLFTKKSNVWFKGRK